ncbi:hypothetical protein CY34DRAFT_109468 [Suillus luteus UH-Slu-Lm8-n1]|uniref:Unplaced genomic scaffold CY34scaffold_387, whole genome shotgun sequence n=1 Tax=Suillus luteus UH-Slu-Lm8-n1 TaxID=930992 RepID=A0A0C9ZGQ3_9AGAM|nr:hypothetical protein CY34DRAFT_109468 [Suillus luteus UH-Slu-Lm8-n1]
MFFTLAMIYESNHDSYSKLLLDPFEFRYNRISPLIWTMLLLNALGTTNTVKVDNSIEEINTETLYTPSIAKVMSFPPIQSFDPGNMTPDSDVRRAVPPERFSHRPGRQGHPYSRNSAATSSTISRTNSESQASEIPLYDDLDSVQGGSESRWKGKQPEPQKLDLTTYSTQERITIDWMRKKVEMDMITTRGWESLVMEEEKSAADTYVKEIVGQANQRHTCDISFSDALATYLWHSLTVCRAGLSITFEPFASKYGIKPPDNLQLPPLARHEFMKARRTVLLSSSKEDIYLNFLHGRKIAGNKVTLVMFGNDNLRDGHIQRWYNDLRSPLCDELFMNSLTTTPFMLLGWSAVGMRCSIDRIVDPRARFSKAKYAAWHSKVVKDMECISRHPVHGEEFKELLLDLHLRGMEVLMKLLERSLNDGVVYIPSSPSEMSQPLDLLESKFNCRISQSSIAPLLHLTKAKSLQSSAAAPLHFESARPESSRVVVQSPEPYLGMGPGPSQISQTHAFAGGHPESLLTPPFADYSQPVFSNSLYRVPGMEFSSAESSEQLRMQENYYDNLPRQQPSESQQVTFDGRSYHL